MVPQTDDDWLKEVILVVVVVVGALIKLNIFSFC